jgi:hypothetical protein
MTFRLQSDSGRKSVMGQLSVDNQIAQKQWQRSHGQPKRAENSSVACPAGTADVPPVAGGKEVPCVLRASTSDRNQCAFRHSARSRRPNASMKALSVDLPRREKSSVTLFRYAHRSSSRDTNSLARSTRIALKLHAEHYGA